MSGPEVAALVCSMFVFGSVTTITRIFEIKRPGKIVSDLPKPLQLLDWLSAILMIILLGYTIVITPTMLIAIVATAVLSADFILVTSRMFNQPITVFVSWTAKIMLEVVLLYLFLDYRNEFQITLAVSIVVISATSEFITAVSIMESESNFNDNVKKPPPAYLPLDSI